MNKFETYIINYNDTYDMIVIKNYPEEIYHYVLLKEKCDRIADLCDDCKLAETKHQTNYVGLHKGYPLNFETAKRYGFNVDYLIEKFRISEAEAFYMAKVLKKNFGLKFKELEDVE